MHEFGAYCDIRLLCPAMFLITKNFGVWGLVVGSNPPKLSFGSSHPLLRRRTTGPMGPIRALKKWDNRVADIGCLAQQDRVELFPWQSFSPELVSVLLRTWCAFCRYPICLLRGRSRREIASVRGAEEGRRGERMKTKRGARREAAHGDCF
jgi:hypothetical protein